MEACILAEKLQEFMDQFGEDAQVRIASQPAWPFEYDIRGCVDSVELGPEEEGDPVDMDGDPEPIFYIVEGAQLGYFRKEAWDTCS
ncbi:unnamed protein product [marine sediment metagenome]|uniref:Uncharacterized protein n=1 Tax=marine sediment metagenome TaxID=412755 RepID=X0WYJ9_9ZZZZ